MGGIVVILVGIPLGLISFGLTLITNWIVLTTYWTPMLRRPQRLPFHHSVRYYRSSNNGEYLVSTLIRLAALIATKFLCYIFLVDSYALMYSAMVYSVIFILWTIILKYLQYLMRISIASNDILPKPVGDRNAPGPLQRPIFDWQVFRVIIAR